MRTLAISLFAVASMALTGCNCCEKQTADTKAVNMGAINSSCPVSGRDAEGGPVVDYNGTQVGLCCNGCVDRWNKQSDTSKQTFVDSSK